MLENESYGRDMIWERKQYLEDQVRSLLDENEKIKAQRGDTQEVARMQSLLEESGRKRRDLQVENDRLRDIVRYHADKTHTQEVNRDHLRTVVEGYKAKVEEQDGILDHFKKENHRLEQVIKEKIGIIRNYENICTEYRAKIREIQADRMDTALIQSKDEELKELRSAVLKEQLDKLRERRRANTAESELKIQREELTEKLEMCQQANRQMVNQERDIYHEARAANRKLDKIRKAMDDSYVGPAMYRIMQILDGKDES